MDKAREEFKQQFSQRQVEITVYYSLGLQALVESYDHGGETATFSCYDYDPPAVLITVRTSPGHSWENGGATLYMP